VILKGELENEEVQTLYRTTEVESYWQPSMPPLGMGRERQMVEGSAQSCCQAARSCISAGNSASPRCGRRRTSAMLRQAHLSCTEYGRLQKLV